jgi:FkbM family methyltransferase
MSMDAGFVAEHQPMAPAKTFPLRLRLLRWAGKQTWIPRGQDRLLRLIWNPDTHPPFLFEIDFFGKHYQGDLRSHIDWSVFAYGSYAYPELSLLETMARELRRVRGHVYFFDVGANLGQHTLFMADKADAVIAFEPYPQLQELIRQKIARNGLTNVHIVPLALGEADETRQYYPGDALNPGTGTFAPRADDAARKPMPLEIRHGDRLCAAMNLPPIDLLKIDVEGFEPMVFRGLAERIRRDRPVILAEMSSATQANYSSQEALLNSFWEGAVCATVQGRNGRTFTLRPFVFGQTSEVLIAPPEMADLVHAQLKR